VTGEAPTYGILGALSAFPRRLAAREVARQGAALRGAAARNLTHLVFGRPLLERMSADDLEKRADKAKTAGAVVLSENGFRRQLGLTKRPNDATVSRSSLIEQSKLTGRMIDMLSLFDAFEQDSEPYAFRDVILGRKYEKLIASGTSWADIARSVHRVGKVASLTALALHGDGKGVYRKDGDRLSEIDGQGLLPFGDDDAHDADELFEAAEAAEQNGDCAEAAELYARYLTLVPNDPVAAFNRANALRAAGKQEDAAGAYALAIKLDPRFAEAWFNYGSLLREGGKRETARLHFARAMELDADYADPVYSLAALEYDAGQLPEARRHWVRYLELDPKSDWAKKATRGIQLIDMTLNAERKRGA
jgi:tetratricopeptide (TPR) repeat protein